LTTLFNNTDITTAAPIDAPLPRKKFSLLPLLTVLFCLSYGLMTMLIVEQGSTIESQRALIRELFRDSTELSAVKMKAQQAARALAGAQPAPSPKTQAPVTQNQPSQVPSPQAPTQQAPSSQAAPQHQMQKQTEKQKPQFQTPSRPAADMSDDRRALITI
jgi:outer membrane biosynthesis protein TonB